MLVTLKVLFFRYAYMLRQRWCLTMSYMLCPLALLLLAMWAHRKFPYKQFKGGAKYRSEYQLLKRPNFQGVEIVVCPDDQFEHSLMRTVQQKIRRGKGRFPLNITYVKTKAHMTDLLVSANTSINIGLQFHEGSNNKLEYTILPQAFNIPAIDLDWGDYRTRETFPSPMLRGPRKSNPYFGVNLTHSPAIISLQVAIDEAYMDLKEIPWPETPWALASFPYPSYFEVDPKYAIGFTHRFILLIAQYLLITGILFLKLVFVSNIINDKMSGIRELLSLNGAHRWMVNPSWLMFSCFEATILAIAEMEILKIPTENGALIQYMSAPVLTIVLIVYHVSSLCWVYFVATIFTNQVFCILTVAAYWGISPILLELIPPGRFTLQACLAPFPNAGMVLIFKSFQEFDGAETVLDWDRLTVSPIHYLPIDKLLHIMLATSVLLILLSIYVDHIKPGPYGRAKPWYLMTRKGNKKALLTGGGTTSESIYFDDIRKEEPVGLECVGICKFFGKNKAVINVNLKIMKNRITVLFGRNGSGKTSLISTLCGMYSPTSGKLYTEEYDVFKGSNIRRFRKVLGYCPQSNILMNDLTFQQNLIIFAMLKGLSRHEAEEYSNEWAEMFDMENCKARQVKYLSGGDRRKLSLAIAMSGQPKYLLLDNPTSGLDPRSTREFWNLISQRKAKCTVFMSTYDMNEADILGDRIILMEKGELKAHASSSFIKKKLGIGYKVNCAVKENDIGKLIQIVMKFNRSIIVLHLLKRTVTFGLPSDFKPKAVPSFLQNLESEFDGNISFEVSNATTEDVLVKLMTEEQKVGLEELRVLENDVNQSSCAQVMEIFKMKIKWACSPGRMSMIVLIMVLPAIGMGLSVYMTNEFLGGGSSRLQPGNLAFTMDKYRGTLAVISKKNNDVHDALKAAMKRSGITYEEVDGDLFNFLGYGLAKKDLFKYRSRYTFAFGNINGTLIAYYSRNAFHSAPIAYLALINAMIHKATNGTAAIVTNISPFVKEQERLACLFDNSLLAGVLFSTILGHMLLISGSYYIIFPHIGRRTLFKQLQLMTGLLPALYWISNLLFDIVIFFMTCMLMICILAITDMNFFWNSSGMLVLVLVLLLYGFSTIIFAYLWSFCRCSTPTVVTWYISIISFLFIGFLLLEVIALFSPTEFVPTDKYLYFLPWVTVMNSLWKLSVWAVRSRQCYACEEIASCAEIWDVPLIASLRRNLFTFVFISLAYFSVLLAMDHGFGRRLKPMINRVCHGDIVGGSGCPEVAMEKQLVRDLDTDEEKSQPELVCDGLGKKYSSKITAVHGITFVTRRGELFGLLGLNGAGKSTTFGMLAGVISPTKGTATIRGKWELGDFEYTYIRNIGYCPQFEGLLPGLSGRTTLRLFGRLRGLKEHLLNPHVEKWLEALGMKSVADRPCEQYSAGDKKKLNFAVAMIANPSVVFLDEPTTGVDPFGKIKIQEILMNFSKQSSQAIVLTTHNMVESEAICDRLVIIVNGLMKCIGSVPTLKNSLGKVCTLRVKFLENTSSKQFNITQFKIEFRFTGYINLQGKLHNLLIYNVNSEKMKIHDIFSIMLKMKEENPAIDDFSLAEAPLEEVFMMFTQKG